MNGAIYVSDSGNSKTKGSEKIDVTYLSIKASCPSTCALKDNGCYSVNSYAGLIVKRLDNEATEMSALQIARAEANAIDNSYKGGAVPTNRIMRLHISGDCRTIAGAKLINNAVGRWKKRGGGKVYSYTHVWDHVMRDIWSNVSMLASVDSIEEVEYARQNGYAPAIVVSEHMSSKAHELPGSDVKWIPCPAQTQKNIGCVDCKLCMNANRLFEKNMGISFAAHGIRKNTIKKRLLVLK